MASEPDAFIRAVDAALDRLARDEGKRISIRKLLERAGADDAMRAKCFYHLNRNRDWPRGHRVPVDVVELLTGQLPVGREELARAAQVAAGFDVEISLEGPDHHIRAIARFFSEGEDEEEKHRIFAEVQRLMADEAQRQRQALFR